MEKRSVILTPTGESAYCIEYKLRAVNPYFSIFRNLKISISDYYWFEGAYRVFDPYNDEQRFLKVIDNFTKVCRIEKYFYINDDGIIMERISGENDIKPVTDLLIIDDEAEEVMNIPVFSLGSTINKYPELKPIVDIGKEK